MSRRTATMKAIDRLNANIKSVVNTFGIDSPQYQQVTQDIFRYQVRTDAKTGAIQIRNTKQNRKQHQSLRARAKANMNVRIVKRKEMKRMNAFNKRAKTKISSLKAFETMQQLQNDKLSFVYDIRDIAQEYDIDFSEYKAMQSAEYLRAKISEIEAAAEYDMGLSESIPPTPTVTINNNGNVMIVDQQTGEILYNYGDGVIDV